jgi:LPS export ABC transporter protein LptC
MEWKNKLRLIQIFLLVTGILIIFFTYFNQTETDKKKIISKYDEKNIKLQNDNQSTEGDIFYNIEYSGLDLAGNRYILKSKEALNKANQALVTMRFVEAVFYFKDGTTLNILSDKGTYNNKTLDMVFEKNVKAEYEGSELFGEKVEYSNNKKYLSISKNVRINDIRGTIVADKLFFDLEKQILDIAAFDNEKINAQIITK